MSFTPYAIIYQSNGTTPIYTISDILTPIDGWPNTDNPKNVTYENIRSAGELSISGGSNSYLIGIRGRLTAGNFTDLMIAFASLQTLIVANTPYVLKIFKSAITYDSFNVKRKDKIEIINSNNLNSWLYFLLNLQSNAW